MNLSIVTESAFWEWLGRASWQSSVLVVLIMVARGLLGKRLTPAWRYRLWWLVVIRLLLPFQATSPTSVHNLARLPLRAGAIGGTELARLPLAAEASERGVAKPDWAGMARRERDVPTPIGFLPAVAVGRSAGEIGPSALAALPAPGETRGAYDRPVSGWGRLLAWVWAIGAVVMAIRVVVQNLIFSSRLRREATPVGVEVAREVENCRRLLGVRTPVRALETSAIESPAVYGVFSPTLLLPRGLASEFTPEQWRYVLLHEMAHVKRRDILTTWLVTGLQAVHWFNPVLWFAFARMRVDRELACDALVLDRSREGEAIGYGETILRLLEVMNRGRAVPGLVGILEDKRQIAERLRMIAAFRRPGRGSTMAGALLVLLGWVGLTDAASDSKSLPRVTPIRLTNVLTAVENRAWREEAVWKVVPRGSNAFGGIEFHLDGLVQLAGTGPEREGKSYRDRVVISLTETNGTASKAKVPSIGANVGALHFVAGTAYDDKPETRIAEVIWRYDDGTFKRSSIQYGVHVRNWWRTRYEEPARLPGPHAKVVWRGTHPEVARLGRSLRLYRFSLANPEPKRVIRQLELLSSRSQAALIVAALTLDPLGPGERPDDSPDLEEADPEPTGRLVVTVQDQAGVALADAEVRIRVREVGQSGSGVAVPKVFRSNSQGMAEIEWSAAADRLQVAVSKDGFAARKIVWEPKTGDVIPASHAVRLRRSIEIGGTVVDPDDQPVAGATVSVFRFWMAGESSVAKGEESDFARQEFTTGADGKWKAPNVPPDLVPRIRADAKHPDYIAASIRVDGELEALKAGTHVVVLGRGLEARGRVLDEADHPVAGATVWSGGRNFPERKETTSDAEGRFVFKNLREGQVLFSVMARSLAPADQRVKVRVGMEEIVFRLKPGRTVRARVQNADEEPLSGVRVVLEGDGNIGRTYEFSTRTDGDGRFEWDGAPEGPMQFYFGAGGYEQKRNHELLPDRDNVVTLNRYRRVRGQIVDSESGEPVGRFRVALGHAFQGNVAQFNPDRSGLVDYSAADGRFEIELDEEQTNAIQAEAEDHAGTIEILPPEQERAIDVVVKLKPSQGLRGMVVDANGNPVVGAHLTVSGPPPGAGEPSVRWGMATLRNGFFEAGAGGLPGRIGEIRSGDDGRFGIASPPLEGIVSAVTPAGFGSASVAEVRSAGRLVLLPYGRIEGTLSVLGQPVAGEEFLLSLGSVGIQAGFEEYRAATDPAGRFVLPRVPAGKVGVIRLTKTSPTSWMHGTLTAVTVEPGQTATITLGHEGSVVQARVRFESPPTEDDVFVSGDLATKGPAMPASFSSEDEVKAFFATPEWTEHMKNQKRYPVRVRPAGSLQLDSVAPGTYRLELQARIPGQQPWEEKIIARGAGEVVVPANGDPAVPIAVGEVLLKPEPKE